MEYDLYSKNIRYVEDEEGEIYYHISKMIHEIFQNGFLENVLRMKVLFQRKLKECGYLSKENEWYQFEDFYKTKKMFFYFKSIDEARRVLNHIIFTIGEIVNPVLYLFMIERLFGSLSGFYEYSSNEAEIKNNEVFYVSSKIYDKISNEYIGMVNKECIRKEIMGTKKKGRRRYFPVSYNKCLDECEYLSYEGVSVNKIFLNRQEYANKMHKSKALIALLCRKGKIHGAFKNNGAWRIPEDAPYPKDGRCRK